MTRIFTTIAFLFSISLNTQATPPTISGTLTFPETGTIYLQLVTQSEFENEQDGQYALVIDVEESPASFSFEAVQPGNYMIRSFQDVNGNGDLDMGLFGPKEPWLILGYKPSAFKRPSFEEHSISIQENMTLDLSLIP